MPGVSGWRDNATRSNYAIRSRRPLGQFEQRIGEADALLRHQHVEKSRHDDSPNFQPLRRQFGRSDIAPALGGFNPGCALAPQLDRLIDLEGRRACRLPGVFDQSGDFRIGPYPRLDDRSLDGLQLTPCRRQFRVGGQGQVWLPAAWVLANPHPRRVQGA